MVKADAYGLGVAQAVRTLSVLKPRAWGVATVEEGRGLRKLGVEAPILVFSPAPPGTYPAAVEAGLTLCLSDTGALDRLQGEARRQGREASFQVEVDTGMGRSGFPWEAAAEWGPRVREAHGRGVRWTGWFTHFHSADLRDTESVEHQIRRFEEVRSRVETPRDTHFLEHTANSAAALRIGGRAGSVARPGIFLYGGRAGGGLPAPEPVAELRARVVHVREAAPGTSVGYGATYRARGRERWATLAIGYGDGLPRALGNRGHALLRGRQVPLVGRVSMDVTVANISEVDGVEPGDVATLVGRDGAEEITVDQVAELCRTIGYEILTGFTPRVPRIWSDG
jgi:alanine racemase